MKGEMMAMLDRTTVQNVSAIADDGTEAAGGGDRWENVRCGAAVRQMPIRLTVNKTVVVEGRTDQILLTSLVFQQSRGGEEVW